ncbi:hypothetical protein N7499_002619 [Penicillium canescens]|nr:hypothetical protein N7522_006694 [Penicillium canescens]KAJ6098245.1 hypothetical protein N7499_002619 [Penicillium canescens]KAJ6166234.1 hypothetical protein N7485_009478 [Penicillium canescens]
MLRYLEEARKPPGPTLPHPRLCVLCDADPNKAASTTTITTTSSVTTEAITPVLFVGTFAGWRLPAKSRGDGLTGLARALKKLAEKWGKGKKERE